MIIAGIDYSIRSPAVCVCSTDHPFIFSNLDFLAMPQSKKIDGEYDNIRIIQNLGVTSNQISRFDHLARNFSNFLTIRGVELVVLEDYAFAGKGRVFHIGENCGILKHYLTNANISILTVAPAALKKFASGKGNAKKDQMIEQFETETDVDLWEHFQISRTKTIPSPIDDIVDSFYLAKYGLAQMTK